MFVSKTDINGQDGLNWKSYAFSVALLTFAGLIIYSPSYFIVEKYYGDAYSYLTLAKGLRHFHYILPFERHLKFMPAYPLSILSLNLLSLGLIDYISSAKLVTMLSFMAAAVLIFDYILFQTRNYRLAILGGLVSILSPISIYCSGNIISEPLFTLFAIAAFLFNLKGRLYWAWLFASFSILTRYEGIFVALTLILMDWKKPRQLVMGLIICLVLYSPWIWHILSNFGKFFAFSYPIELINYGRRTGPVFFYDIFIYLSPLIAILGVIGISKWPGRQRLGTIAFVSGFTAIHLIWYFRSSRFVIPLVPFFAVGSAFSIKYAADKAVSFSKHGFLYAYIAVILAMIPFDIYSYSSLEKISEDPLKETVQAILKYDASAVVLANIEPTLFYWYGGNKIYSWIDLNQGKNPYSWVAEQYLNNGARYLVWSRTDDYSLLRFKELAGKDDASVEVEYLGRQYILRFSQAIILKNKDMTIYFLELKPASTQSK